MQELPDQQALTERLKQEGLDELDENARKRFIKVMKKHKYMYDEEGDFM